MTPERIGRYTVTGVVGAGGFATVLHAVDDRLEAEVAIKVLAENHSLDPDVRERFLSEGRVLRRIDSPHVVRVLDLGETERQQPYLVLELADRGDLAARVAELRGRGWRPGPDDVEAFARPLVEALGAVHRAGVVHRDLSPGNLLLRTTLAPDPDRPPTELIAADERLVVADLGLSKDLARSSGLTAAGGTDGFRPPEQRGPPSTVDARADLWSLSALVVWLVTGETPTDQRHAKRLLRTTDLPAGARDVLVRGLADDPARRQADVAAWADGLRTALRPPPASDTEVTATPTPRRRLAWRLLAATLAVGLLVGAGTTVWLARDPDPVTTVTDGQVRVVATDGDLEAVLTGPETVTAGATAIFNATASGADGLVWVTPEGGVVADAPSLTVETRSAGGATVTLVATAQGGHEVRVSHRLRVTEGPDG